MGVGQKGQMKVFKGHGQNGWGLSLHGCSFCPEKGLHGKSERRKAAQSGREMEVAVQSLPGSHTLKAFQLSIVFSEIGRNQAV